MDHARPFFADEAPSGWYALLPPPPPARRPSCPLHADCAVIGAGFTGLRAARRLAELAPDWRIVVLERSRVGQGTAGRNSGFVVDFANNGSWGPEAGRRYVRLGRAGLAELRRAAHARGLTDCWSDVPWLHTAAHDASLPSLEGLRRRLDEAGEAYEWLERDAVAGILGSGYYRAAIRVPGSAMIQPAAFVRGLAEHLPENVELYEGCPVEAIEDGRRIRLATGAGEITADRLVVAANGYSNSLGVLRQRVFPLLSFGSLTRVLDERQRQILGGDPEWGLVAVEPFGASVRRTRDHRILIRNTYHYSRDGKVPPELLTEVEAARRQAFRERFPQLGEVGFEHRWIGTLGISHNNAVHFGRLRDNVFAAAAYNGAGIGMGTIAGRLLAELATGHDSELLRDMLAQPGPDWIPPEPLFTPIARLHLRRLARRAVVKL